MPTSSISPTFTFDNTLARVLEGAFVPWRAAAAPAPRLLRLNRALAGELGLDADALSPEAWAALLVGNDVPDGAEPIALAYAGHQFGGFSPRLGDGRALLLGELLDRGGRRVDLQLKGSGPTPFARGGDGKATLGPVLREYVMGEAMAALGIPTTRALGAVATGEIVMRDRPLPGAVLARIASSHLRVGTFQFFSAREDHDRLARLLDYAIARHDPGLAEHPRKALALVTAVGERQAALVARWMHVGFIHGVMNTDNVAISGETIDYGPCAFMDTYDPATVYSSIDHNGRYAYGNQPRVAQWNLARLGEALLPLIHDDLETAAADATAVVRNFIEVFQRHWLLGMRPKLGLTATRTDDEGDQELGTDYLSLLETHQVDFTLGFRALVTAATDDRAALDQLFSDPVAYQPWLARWQTRLGARAAAASEEMRATNPAFIPRNHRVEAALDAAIERNDFRPFETLLTILARPFDDQPEHAALMEPPPRAQQRLHRTFCGT